MDNNSYQAPYQQPQPPQYGYGQNPPPYNYGQNPPYGGAYDGPQAPYPPYPPQKPRGKSGFLTFCFAFVPGAGQMYLGHMKRGFSIAALFFGLCLLSTLVSALAILLPVVWMYGFFDTFNLRSHLMAGTEEPDDFLFHLGELDAVKQLASQKRRLLGWGLIALGIWAVYDGFVMNFVFDFCDMLGNYFLYDLLNDLPGIAVVVALIWLGWRLVRGPQQKGGFVAAPEDDIQYYTAQPDAGFAPAAPAETDQPEMDFVPDAVKAAMKKPADKDDGTQG